MPFALLKYGLSSKYPAKRHFPKATELKPAYDVVIVGAGGHGLAAAYYLAKDWGITNVAVLDGLSRRRQYRAQHGHRPLELSDAGGRAVLRRVRPALSGAERGSRLSTSSIRSAAISPWPIPMPRCAPARWRAEVNKHLGRRFRAHRIPTRSTGSVRSSTCPTTCAIPILGALYHPPGAIVRHDAVAWGYARDATERGVEIHTRRRSPVRREGPRHRRGDEPRPYRLGKVLQAVAGSSQRVAAMAGFRLPIRTIPLQACVSEPLKPFLDQIVVSGSLHVYVSQSVAASW